MAYQEFWLLNRLTMMHAGAQHGSAQPRLRPSMAAAVDDSFNACTTCQTDKRGGLNRELCDLPTDILLNRVRAGRPCARFPPIVPSLPCRFVPAQRDPA